MVDSYNERYDEFFWSTLRDAIGPDSRKTIAEFGCGPGLFLSDAIDFFNSELAYGFDSSSKMLEYARGILQEKLPDDGLTLECIDFDRKDIPIDEPIVDLAFSGFFLHEVDHPESHLRDALTALSPGGLYAVYDFVSGNRDAFISIMTQKGMDSDRAEARYPHMCRHSIEDIGEIFEDADYDSVRAFRIDEIRAIVIGAKE